MHLNDVLVRERESLINRFIIYNTIKLPKMDITPGWLFLILYNFLSST